MRTLLQALLFALAILLVSSTSASSQGDGCFGPPYDGTSFEYVGGQMHVNVELVQHPGFYNTNCWNDVVGVFVFRRTVGVTCIEEVQVTPTLLDWNEDAAPLELFVSAQIVDTGVEANRAYQYIARPVGFVPNDDCILGYVSTGPALIGRGMLYQAPDCGFSGLSSVGICLPDCFTFGYFNDLPAEGVPYINTGTSLAIYGEFAGVISGVCNASFPVLNITDVEEASCVNAVETMSWGAVKAKYR
jgi:hypothetical protein